MFNKTDYDKELIVCYSGGIGSFLAAYYLKFYLKKMDVKLVFTDTKTEDPTLYEFLEKTAAFIGYPLIKIEDGRDVFQVFIDIGYMGNTRIDPCSQTLKRRVFKKYLSDFSSEKVALVFGIDLFESDRLERLRSRYEFSVLSPAVDFILDRESLLREALEASGCKLPYLYQIGMTHNNCGGFCVKAGTGHYKNLLEKDPDRYEYFVQKEKEVYDRVPAARPFLRIQKNGTLQYVTLEEFRSIQEAAPKQLELDLDFSGCACFTL
jgi:tRNA(Ile)-lysidine synthase TilS/MesJ